jgi:hypothetical protein
MCEEEKKSWWHFMDQGKINAFHHVNIKMMINGFMCASNIFCWGQTKMRIFNTRSIRLKHVGIKHTSINY